MDLEVVGRHALFFDDDAMAAFVNSPDALVGWSSLTIDRYDLRHLLSTPPAPQLRRRHRSSPLRSSDDSLQFELDYERYLDLPPPSDDEGTNSGAASSIDSGFHSVGLSYGNIEKTVVQIADDMEPGFQPPFLVPEGLLQNLPPTEKLHQIIARTAAFVSKNGGQSEIVLRVKQGDNPTFGFLMPDHRLHPYFRFLIDHQELLKPDNEEKSSLKHAGGALSLLGTVYGDGEEEDNAAENSPGKFNAVVVKEGNILPISHGSDHRAPSANLSLKEELVLKHPVSCLKEKSSIVKKGRTISMVNAGSESALRRDGETSLPCVSADKKKSSAFPTSLTAEKSILEPPSEMKRLVDKIVEFILKNGRQFETILFEQDKGHGRFPFLQPSNQYHLFYLKALEKAGQLKLPRRKNDMPVQGVEKKFENDDLSVGSDIPDDLNKKERFKMVIVRTKREGQEQASKESREENGFGVDAAAAAAILQAARKGIKNPKLEILPKSQPLHGEGSCGSESPQPLGSSLTSGSTIARIGAAEKAFEADSSEAGFTKEQKLRAERLKRAKMFTAMLKSGAVASKACPLNSVVSGLNVEAEPSGEEEGSSLPSDSADANERNERRMKRSYRSRNKIQNRNDEKEEENDGVVGEDKERLDSRHSRKKRRSHGSSHQSKERRKRHRKKHSSYSKDEESEHRRHKLKDSSTGEVEHRQKRLSRHMQEEDDIDSSSDGEDHRHWKLCRRNNNIGSSGDDGYEDDHHGRRSEGRHKRDNIKKHGDLEEGDELGESKADRLYIREAFVDTSGSSYKGSKSTEVPDDLRAKIRAMLMATM